MKRILTMTALAALLSHCNDKGDPEPVPEVAGIAGAWQLVSTSYQRGDSTITQYPAASEPYIMRFRHDGIPTNAAGQRFCCPPARYVINGVPFQIKLIGEAPPADPQCSLVDCLTCAEWKITQQADSLEVQSCLDSRSKYVRVK